MRTLCVGTPCGGRHASATAVVCRRKTTLLSLRPTMLIDHGAEERNTSWRGTELLETLREEGRDS